MSTEQKKSVDEVMTGIHPNFRRWCSGGLCGCMGCCNREMYAHGYTQEDFKAWQQRQQKETKP